MLSNVQCQVLLDELENDYATDDVLLAVSQAGWAYHLALICQKILDSHNTDLVAYAAAMEDLKAWMGVKP